MENEKTPESLIREWEARAEANDARAREARKSLPFAEPVFAGVADIYRHCAQQLREALDGE